MDRDTIVGVDSQCLSYLIDAFHGIEEPKDPLALERVALARIFFYTKSGPFTTPTVIAECSRIRSSERRETHESWVRVHFGECHLTDPSRSAQRTDELFAFHPKRNDCQILAEAEGCDFSALLTYDSDFLSRLSGRSTLVRLEKPSQYWAGLGIPKGAAPIWVPDFTNPLSQQDWWKW